VRLYHNLGYSVHVGTKEEDEQEGNETISGNVFTVY